MRTTHQMKFGARLGILIAGLACLHAQAGVIDVNSSMAAAVNQNANAKAAVLQAIGINEPDKWQLQSFKVSKMRNTGVKMELPKAKYEFVASKEVVNCDATGTLQTIMLAREVTNSTSVSKSNTFDASVSATVSASSLFVSGSATASAGLSMTDSNTASKSESVSIAQSTTIQFADVGGRITVLQALKMQSNQIPWTATFTPDDDDNVQVTAERRNVKEKMCIWANDNFTGHSKCYALGRGGDVVEMAKRSKSISVPDGLVVRMWKNRQKTGETRDLHKSWKLDNKWKDHVGSFVVLPATKSGKVRFSAIKDRIPEDKRTFTASGTMQMSRTTPDSTKIVNYPMNLADWQDTCAMPPMGHEMAMSTSAPQAIRAAGTKDAPRPGAAASKSAPKKGVKVRELTEEQLKARLKGAKPLPG